MTRRLSTIAVTVAALFCFAAASQVQEATLATASLDASKLRVHFIDIGPGLAMLIETPNDNRHIFVDGGKWSLDDLMTYLAKFVPTTTAIDIGIVTHADSDHYKGMSRVFETYAVKEFWYTGYESEELTTVDAWGVLKQRLGSEDGCVAYVPLGDYVSVGGMETIDDQGTPETTDDVIVQFLNVDQDPPDRDPIFGRSFDEGQRRNNASLVFKLIYKDVSFLITGDINGRNKDLTEESMDGEIDSEELELWVRHSL